MHRQPASWISLHVYGQRCGCSVSFYKLNVCVSALSNVQNIFETILADAAP